MVIEMEKSAVQVKCFCTSCGELRLVERGWHCPECVETWYKRRRKTEEARAMDWGRIKDLDKRIAELEEEVSVLRDKMRAIQNVQGSG